MQTAQQGSRLTDCYPGLYHNPIDNASGACLVYTTKRVSIFNPQKSNSSSRNEVNIFSHVLGSALFFLLPIPIYNAVWPRYATASTADLVVFSTFFFGVATCFALSATFHIFNNHSESVHVFGNQLDYVSAISTVLKEQLADERTQLGIVLLMWGSTIPCVYYGFYCTPELQRAYYSLVSVLAVGCVYATLHPAFRRPKYRPYRAAMYSGLGLSFIIPIIHGLILFGWETQMWRMSLDWMALMTTFNLTGGALYALRVSSHFLYSN
jgi:adiponectin receptor